MWTEQRLKKYREKAEISRFKPFEHEIRWRGYKLATVHQKTNGNYVIEIKIGHIASKTLINSVKFLRCRAELG